MAQLDMKIHDDIDKTIVSLVNEAPDGVRLKEISRKIGLTWPGTRYRVKDLERQGLLKTSSRRHKFLVFPADMEG